MLADQNGAIGRAYNVYDEQAQVNMRGQFIIDPEGVIQTIEVVNAPIGRNIRETMRQIKALQKVRESNGKEAIPAGWTPGKATLKPSAELVGKVWKEMAKDQ